ncbi:hypothetical protein SERLA73DRAFT_187262 [Serpula lacrymans var. lacrymans S7.3]|uniref:Uncharacterized protein n=2 Tax=Serpula lacrymans var. lacrymans TaxID=341189 RepID=F8Q8T2_SERL3|nr:uncharacterized protein SERLADRAFT_476703 [Serpula lacrymans var. lacrymans S7.9]EGN94987.1 hypothetical protein SERLA73DRAFT_187262 [Serpula lacrymans var. lacrymans S7.3]EGO20479.1 hypothetical protein SERLADRAFT_476703 [Serpula lacrymans var. lacrymans S7.9]
MYGRVTTAFGLRSQNLHAVRLWSSSSATNLEPVDTSYTGLLDNGSRFWWPVLVI